jgi:drug/metabolite transporter (DMT)-like permease
VGSGLIFAILAALCTAGATMMQAIGAQRAQHFPTVDARLLLRLIKSMPYVIGLILLTISFAFSLVALHSTALFVVQAISAASLAVIAGLSTVIYRMRLSVVEWAAVGAVLAGVILLVLAQRSSTADNLPPIGEWAMLGAALLLTLIAFVARRALTGAALAGLLAGLAFGDTAVASRIVARVDPSWSTLLSNPATYAIAIGGLVGTLLFATALQSGSVTAVFGMSTVGQTLGPAVTGWLLLGDSVQPGTLPVAAVGFGLTVVGAVVLGRHVHPQSAQPVLVAEMTLPAKIGVAGGDSRSGSGAAGGAHPQAPSP